MGHRLFKISLCGFFLSLNVICAEQAPKSEQVHVCPYPHALGITSLKKESQDSTLIIHGTIPAWLNGSFITLGPSVFELNTSKANYWLDGFGMIHQFNIQNGKISYTNKLIDSFYYQDCCKKGKLRGSAPEQKKSTWAKLTSALTSTRPIYDNANMNVAIFNNQLVALTETPIPIQIDKKSLESKGKFVFDDAIDTQFASSHPIFDPTTKEWYGLGIHFAHNSNYIVYKMKQDSNKRIAIATISVGYPAYMHSFALTQHYIILTEAPFTVSPYDLLLSDHSFIGTFNWQPKNGSQFIIIDRKTGKKIGTYKTDSFFTLHHVNAFEKDDAILLDVIVYKDPDIVTKGFNLANLNNANPALPASHLKRFTINPKKNLVSANQLSPHSLELPAINTAKYMHDYRYIYATQSDQGFAQQLIKLDLHSKRHHTWHCKGCYPGEPIFVANPNAEHEDDGVILSLVLDTQKQKSFLVILDAKTFKEIGRAYAPHHIPFTTHSKFFKP